MNARFSKIYCCLTLALLGVLVYGNHLHNTFQFDSVAYIKNNLQLKNPESILTLDFWTKQFFARGLLSISMAFNASLDGLRPFGYHVLNLVLHIFNSILIFYIFRKALVHFKNQAQSSGNNAAISFFAAAIFLIHPIQTESVIYIISRSEILASTFYLLAFLIFQICLNLDTRQRALKITLLSLLIFFLAVVGFSVKQTLATFPLILFLYYIAICPLDSPIIQILYKWRWFLLTGISVFLSLLFYKLLNDEIFLIGPSNPDEMVGRAKYMLSQPAVVVFYYLKKILFPINLNIDPDIEVVTQLFSFGFIAGIGSIVLIIYYFWKQEAWRFYLFFLAWFFIILSPSSSIVTLHDLAAEHRVYLAIPGVIFIFSYGIFRFLKNQAWLRIIDKSVLGVLVLCEITLLFGILSIERNKVWRTELTLWQDSYEKSPDKLRPLINLARAHSVEGNLKDAIRYYEASLVKGPGVFVPHYNLGELYLNEGRVEEAFIRFKSALQLDPKIPETYAKLGEIYLKQEKWKLADVYFKKCIEIDNRFSHVFKNLGILHFYHLKNLKESLLYFSRSLALEPNQEDADEIRKLIALYQGGNLSLPSQRAP
ncbi:MAG: tetratricopeptide repeat protein [Nitrospinae bacterium]|nr:tetratricopeptide repeat protein [Nitrospinota bacterium]